MSARMGSSSPSSRTPRRTRSWAVGLFGFVPMRTGTVLPLVLSAFGSARRVGGRHVTYVRDRTQFRIQSDRALPAQVDGEYIGEHTDLIVESLPDALSVVC